MAEALEDEVVSDPSDVSAYHRSIRTESIRLTEMVDGLFELARLNSGELQLHREPVTVADLVAQSLPSASALAATKQIRIVDDVPESVVDIDMSEFDRVVRNLLSNAIQHTPTGGEISVVSRDDCGAIRLSVSDQCGGIAPEHMPHVFDIGFRATAARTPSDSNGAGLGLAIARAIVHAHDGDIDVANTPDGCRFTVTLPMPQVV
jgi:signal transduction histidine kinase